MDLMDYLTLLWIGYGIYYIIRLTHKLNKETQ